MSCSSRVISRAGLPRSLLGPDLMGLLLTPIIPNRPLALYSDMMTPMLAPWARQGSGRLDSQTTVSSTGLAVLTGVSSTPLKQPPRARADRQTSQRAMTGPPGSARDADYRRGGKARQGEGRVSAATG